ncbi:MAG: hypothetical protein H0V82_00585 [Candidatus Protochlamydia sp.]|nr:hypothetical protein [Candidatus Protochlamydia sp.]
MQMDNIISTRPLYTPEEFIHLLYASKWQRGNGCYMQAVTTGRCTYVRTWKVFETFCRAQGLGSPIDLQCGNKRYIGISLSEDRYHQLIQPVQAKLKDLQKEYPLKIYLEQLEKQSSLSSVEKRIVHIYWSAISALSPVPSLQSLCKKRCEELGYVEKHEEKIGIIIDNIEYSEAPHNPPNLISDPNLPPILNPDSLCIIS